jgi:uncharacterized protein (TIGR02453 family)
MHHPPFPGFRPEALQFLRDLIENNNRDWFKPRKSIYDDELKWPLECLVSDVARQAQEQNLTIGGDPKKSLFRIYRDVRFSKNKNPYKTHVSAVLSRSGSRKDTGGLYVHIEPSNIFLAAGFWRPDATMLRAWRNRMSDDPDGFMRLVQHLENTGLEFAEREPLKRLPRGFQDYADTAIADHLRWKSFIVVRNLKEDNVLTPAFTETLLQMTRDSYPLLEYGWQILDALREVEV